MKLKLCPTIVMAVVNQNIIKTFYSVSSVNRSDIVLISVKRKAGILIRNYVRLFMSYPSQPKGKSDSEDNKVYVRHLTPSQQSKVAQLMGKRCTVDCLLNGKQGQSQNFLMTLII